MTTEIFEFSSKLTIQSVDEIKARFEDILRKEVPMEIKLGNVEQIDTAGVQLLLMIKKAARDTDVEVTFTHLSEIVKDSLLLLLGTSSEFNF